MQTSSALWAIDAASLSSVQTRLAELEVAARSESKPRTASPSILSVNGGVGTISVTGPILRALGWLEPYAGLFNITSQESIRSAFETAQADASVKEIIFNIDSPGGVFAGVCELASIIEQSDKPTTARVSGMACSAAYWLACSCDRVECTSSSTVGSVGVIAVYVDASRSMEANGLKQHVFRVPEGKAPGTANEALSEAQQSSIRAGVERAHTMFKSYVQTRRPRADARLFSGETIMGCDAVGMRIVDGLTGTQGIPTRSGSGSSATAEASLEAQWNADPALRDEFLGSFSTFAAYRRNEGRRIFKHTPPTPEHLDAKREWDADENLRAEFGFDFKCFESYAKARAAGLTK